MNTRTADTILYILFVASLLLAIWGVEIYRMTIIPSKYLIGIMEPGTIK